MLQSISIENFRCFKKTTFKGFARLNLIGGKNNAGKTSFLEAVATFLSGDLTSRHGKEANGEEAYQSFFYEKDIKQEIIIKGLINEEIEVKGKYQKGTKTSENYKFISHSFILNSFTQFPYLVDISKTFDEQKRQGKLKTILESVKIIEPNIEEISTFSDSKDLFLRFKGKEKYISLSYFGDATQKILRYLLTIISLNTQYNKENIQQFRVLLIDEIENGLHYTAHKEFWAMLFKLAMEYDFQIFACTHSKEMIEAFAETALANNAKWEKEVAYFEMARHFQTNDIITEKFEISLLDYGLKNNKNLRGE